MGLINSTNHIIPITRNQTVLVSKTGVLYESLASVYSIDIPRLKNDGYDVGVLKGDVTGLFNRMITIPLTNVEDMSVDIVQDNIPSQSPSKSTFIYLDDLKVVRNYDSTIVPVFSRKNLYNYMDETGHILQKKSESTYSQKGHNHKDTSTSEKNYKGTFITSVKYDKTTKKLIFYSDDNTIRTSIQMSDYVTTAEHLHYYVTSIKYDNTTSKISYQSSSSWTVLNTVLSNVLAKGEHRHKYITSFNYDERSNKLKFNCADGTSILSDELTKSIAKGEHEHKYITSFNYDENSNNKLKFNCADGTSILSDVLTKSIAKNSHNHDASYLTGSISYTSTNHTLSVLGTTSSLNKVISPISHTHETSYIMQLTKGGDDTYNIWTVTFGNNTTTSFNTYFLTSVPTDFTSFSTSSHKHDAICISASGTSAFYYKSSSSALISVYDIYKSSDIRLKDHIQTISSSDKLESFVKFRWKESGNDSYGVIAQEVEKSHPELVNTNDEGFKSVEYQGLLCNQIGKLCEDLKEKGILTDEDFV